MCRQWIRRWPDCPSYGNIVRTDDNRNQLDRCLNATKFTFVPCADYRFRLRFSKKNEIVHCVHKLESHYSEWEGYCDDHEGQDTPWDQSKIDTFQKDCVEYQETQAAAAKKRIAERIACERLEVMYRQGKEEERREKDERQRMKYEAMAEVVRVALEELRIRNTKDQRPSSHFSSDDSSSNVSEKIKYPRRRMEDYEAMDVSNKPHVSSGSRPAIASGSTERIKLPVKTSKDLGEQYSLDEPHMQGDWYEANLLSDTDDKGKKPIAETTGCGEKYRLGDRVDRVESCDLAMVSDSDEESRAVAERAAAVMEVVETLVSNEIDVRTMEIAPDIEVVCQSQNQVSMRELALRRGSVSDEAELQSTKEEEGQTREEHGVMTD